MKKTAILFAAVSFGLAGSLSGCASDENFTAQQYVAEGEVVSLSVDVSDRAVKLMPSEDGKLRIDYYESEKTSYDISLSEEGVLSVTLDLDQSWTDFVGVQPAAEYRTVCVYLPQELTDVSVSTINEAISATGTIAAQNVSMSVNGGDLSFEKIAAEKSVTLNAKNGNITGTVLWEAGTITRSPATSKRARVRSSGARRGGARRFLWTATTATLRSKSQTRKFYLSCARKNTDVNRPCFFRPEVRP